MTERTIKEKIGPQCKIRELRKQLSPTNIYDTRYQQHFHLSRGMNEIVWQECEPLLQYATNNGRHTDSSRTVIRHSSLIEMVNCLILQNLML